MGSQASAGFELMSCCCVSWEMVLPRDLCCRFPHSLIFYRFAMISGKFRLSLLYLQNRESVYLAVGLLK